MTFLSPHGVPAVINRPRALHTLYYYYTRFVKARRRSFNSLARRLCLYTIGADRFICAVVCARRISTRVPTNNDNDNNK